MTFPIDTHIHRLAQGGVLTNGKNVVEEEDLKRLFLKKNWNKLHLQIIYYGKEYCKAKNVMDYLVKSVLLAILRKKTLITKSLNYENTRIGNAIVDVICKVEDDFISKNNLTKAQMKLIFDDKEFKEYCQISRLKKLYQEVRLQTQL